MSEWLKEAVSKTVVPQGTGGSNPPCSVAKNLLKIFDFDLKVFLERCPSGRRYTIGSRVCLKGHRGFKSLSLRCSENLLKIKDFELRVFSLGVCAILRIAS